MKSRTLLRSRLAVGLLASALFVSGCANSSDDADKSSPDPTGSDDAAVSTAVTGFENVDDSGEPTDGGTLTIAEYGEARSLDPTKTYANGATGGSALAAVYDTLTRYNFEDDTFEPQLAESLTSDDDITWTLTLRDGVKFSDGTPLDAAAVLGSLGYYQENYAYNSLIMLANVESMKAGDDMSVVFKMRQPWAKFPNMLAGGPGMIMAPAAYKDPEDFKPIGAGPFTFETYSAGEELVLAAKEDYFNGRPHLDKLRFVWPGADQAKIESLQAGDVDGAFVRDENIVAEARADKTPGFLFVTGMGDNFWINNREGRPGSDIRVRQAIDFAFDPAEYYKRLDANAIPTKAMFAESSPWNSGVTPNAADPAKAKELLEAAKADGYDGKLSYVHGADPAGTAAAVATKAILESVGFKVELVALKSVADQVQKLYVDHDFDLAVAGITIGDEDPYSRLAGILGSQSPSNTSGYTNPKMDKLLAELAAAGTPDEGAATIQKINEMWNAEVPGIGMSVGVTLQAWTEDVHGVVPTTETMVLYDKAWKS